MPSVENFAAGQASISATWSVYGHRIAKFSYRNNPESLRIDRIGLSEKSVCVVVPQSVWSEGG